MRRRLLVMPSGTTLAHVSRTLTIARVLRDRGHEVAFALAGRFSNFAIEDGFPVLDIVGLPHEQTLQISRSGRCKWYSYETLRDHVRAERELLGHWNPDMVLTDFRLSLSTSCEKAGIPLAVILNASWTNHYAVRMRAPEHLVTSRILGCRLATALMPAIKPMVLWIDASAHRRLRGELGLAPRGNIFDIWRGDLNLIADLPEYGPMRAPPPSFHFIGPLLWQPDIAVPDWLDRLDPSVPLIYATVGSTGNPKLLGVVDRIAARSSYNFVVSTAGTAAIAGRPNLYAADYLPALDVIKRASAVVCQGGNGTIYQAASAGVPLVGVPTMHDQEFGLDRVAHLGMGIHLPESRVFPNHGLPADGVLQEALERILTVPAYRAAAQRLALAIAQYDAPQAAAVRIEDYLEARQSCESPATET